VYANVSTLFGVLVARQYATLHDLETVYSYGDALDMAEIIQVNDYNEWAVNEHYRTRRN